MYYVLVGEADEASILSPLLAEAQVAPAPITVDGADEATADEATAIAGESCSATADAPHSL